MTVLDSPRMELFLHLSTIFPHLFPYISGCGKTYTMLGTDHEPGIYVQTLNDLFHAIEETSNDMEYEVSMSYLEVGYFEVLLSYLFRNRETITQLHGVYFPNFC